MWWWQAAILGVGVVVLTGCATTGPVSASGRRIPPAVWTAAEARVAQENPPAELRLFYLDLYAEGRENEALHQMRLGLAALRTGHKEIAKRALDAAIRDVESLTAGAAAAQRATGRFVREQTKWFKGESYERAALFLYRGLLYLADEDFGNAAACFKRAQLQDVTGDDAPGFAGDWFSAEWALAFAALKQGFPQDAEAAVNRAAQFSTRQDEVPWPRAQDNVLVVVEVGRGPQKYRAGRYGEQLRFQEVRPAVRTVEVRHGERVLATSAAAENLYVQATTRGTRQVDHILQGKAAFKEGAGTAAVALGVGAVVAAHHRGREADIATGVLGGLAVISAIVSEAATPEADVRGWDALPHSIYLVGVELPAGPVELEVRGRGAGGESAASLKLPIIVQPNDPIQVVMVRL